MKVFYKVCGVLIALLLFSQPAIEACTNFLITRGASLDGSTMVTYTADSHVLFGELYFTPAGRHIEGSPLRVFEWDTGKYLGDIKQVASTYSVVGNMNEHQLVIGETTFGGRRGLHDPKGIIDYGSLMYLALQRAKTAREAIRVMTDLVREYGYYSSGESFSIADANEVWIMEMIGKGPENKGAVWVARRVPEGYISAHANQARIRQFPLANGRTSITCKDISLINNPRIETVYAHDTIEFARSQEYFAGPDQEFSFTDAYAPLSFGGLRFCEARVWSMFRRAAPSLNISPDFAMGVAGAEPMPLWIKPDKKLSVRDVMELLRDHFQDSEMDLTVGIDAGPYGLPYRWRPLTWKVDEEEYFNERATSTQQTGFSFVSQSRSWLPDPIGGVLWFGVDDTYSTVYMPMYCGIREVPKSLAVGTADFDRFSWDSAFWVFNFVANWAYSRYQDMIQDIQIVQRELEGAFLARQPEIDQAALQLFKSAPELARDYLTAYSIKQAEMTTRRWKELGEHLIWKYLDGNVRNELGKVTHPGYPDSWQRRIIKERGDHYRVKKVQQETERP